VHVPTEHMQIVSVSSAKKKTGTWRKYSIEKGRLAVASLRVTLTVSASSQLSEKEGQHAHYIKKEEGLPSGGSPMTEAGLGWSAPFCQHKNITFFDNHQSPALLQASPHHLHQYQSDAHIRAKSYLLRHRAHRAHLPQKPRE